MADITIKFQGEIVTVRQSKDGLYCLNDVHKASPHEGDIKDLIRHITEKQIGRFDLLTKKGRYGGTYGNEISPKEASMVALMLMKGQSNGNHI